MKVKWNSLDRAEQAAVRDELPCARTRVFPYLFVNFLSIHLKCFFDSVVCCDLTRKAKICGRLPRRSHLAPSSSSQQLASHSFDPIQITTYTWNYDMLSVHKRGIIAKQKAASEMKMKLWKQNDIHKNASKMSIILACAKTTSTRFLIRPAGETKTSRRLHIAYRCPSEWKWSRACRRWFQR